MIKSNILENIDYNSIFTNENSTIDEIANAGEEIIMQLYGNKQCRSLDDLRGVIYMKKLHSKSVKKKINPQSLPPSSNAAKYHSLRVYHTVQEWLGRLLDARMYGFYDFDGSLEPITYKGPLAPEKMLKTILCNCKKSDCKSGNCSCKSFGLYCNELCGCSDNCSNGSPIVIEQESVNNVNEHDGLNQNV